MAGDRFRSRLYLTCLGRLRDLPQVVQCGPNQFDTSAGEPGGPQAVGYARNQWPSLVRYIEDARFAIDNGPAERAIRPIAAGRANWLQIGGDGGLATASVLLSVCASARRHRLDPWAYLTHVPTELPTRRAAADTTDLLPDRWTVSAP